MRIRWIGAAALAALGAAACGGHSFDNVPGCDSWQQWGNNASHNGMSCVRGEPLRAPLGDMVYDPFIASEVADAGGVLIVHYQAPLIDGDALYMMTKKGTYTPCAATANGPDCNQPDERYRLNSQIWSEQRFALGQDGSLTLRWSFDSDWKPEPMFGFEPMFQPALAGAVVAIPGAGGALWEVNAATGIMVRHVEPFGSVIDPDTYVAGGLAVGDDGTIYYNALKLDHDMPFSLPSQAWLVAVAPDGTTRTADYRDLVRGAPAASDLCLGIYDQNATPLPWPPQNPDGTLITPPSAPCGPQRPGINSTPAIGADGTIFLVSRAHNNARYSYVVAVDGDLSPRWATSLRDALQDGCGVTNPIGPGQFDCKPGTPSGVEQATGALPAGTVDDDSSSTPVALPDGGVIYGAYTGYNGFRGHLFKIDRTGAIAGTYDFGWDSTPAVFGDASSYKIVIKDNHYGTDANGVDLGPYYITELDSSFNVLWKFQSTNTQSCARASGGSVGCIADHPHGFEWCVNAVAVDREGTVFANSEDGNVYAISADGTLRDSAFLDRALGAAYTPIALDKNGHVLTLNSGHLAVVGGPY